VELLLNIAWLVLSVSLAFCWIRGWTCSKILDRKLQLLALAMLIIILLPVISMTDDMQAISTAEIEHVTRRADWPPNSDQLSGLVVALNIQLFASRHFFNLQTFARVEPAIENVRPQSVPTRQMANRPPPFTA
jgi:hypothetical protein